MKKARVILVAAMILTMGVFSAVLVHAAAGVSITAYFDNIKVFINGDELQMTDATGKGVEPFIYDGSTYLPIRAVSEAMNMQVDWDGDRKHVLISAAAPISSVPEEMAEIILPDMLALIGQTRRDICDENRMELSERGGAFWYSSIGLPEDDKNVYVSYTDNYSYSGICSYISGEIEHMTVFEKGTTIGQFEEETGLASFETSENQCTYRMGDYLIFAELSGGDSNVIERIAVKYQPE